MENEAIVETFPAYDVVRRALTPDGYLRITIQDTLGLKRADYYSEFRPGSVVSYALACGECPVREVDRARKHGYALHWLNASAVAITARKQAKRRLIVVAVGDRLLFEGRRFQVKRAPNDNLALRELEAE